jgi:F-type H+-transporting ATPase subunit b
MNVTATLIGQMGTFLVLVWFVMRYLWEPMTAAMADRQKRISHGLAAADRGKHELELAQKKSVSYIKEAKQQAADIVAQANKRASEVMEENNAALQVERQRQLEVARVEIEQEMNRAKAQLREQISELVISGVEKILEREINAKAHGEFVDKLVEKL